MKIGFLKDNESRVSLTPITLSKYEKLGYKIYLESGAGSLAGYLDKAYECEKLTKNDLIKESDVIVCVDSSAIADLNKLNNKIVITNDPNKARTPVIFETFKSKPYPKSQNK